MEENAFLWSKGEELSSVVVIGILEEGLYKFPGHYVHALAHNTISSSELWDRRFSHLHFKALPGLQPMVSGMFLILFDNNEACKGCLLGKNTKKSFSSSNNRSQKILELIHSDICGPMSSPSFSGYFIFVFCHFY